MATEERNGAAEGRHPADSAHCGVVGAHPGDDVDLATLLIEALRQRVSELEAIICGDSVRFLDMGLTRREARLLGAMLRREAVTHEEINIIATDDVMDAGGGLSREAGRSLISRLRRKLPKSVEIVPVRHAGYRLTAEAKRALMLL